MSKVIVDQIQKNGGTTFTLPSTDGGANAPLTTNASGTLAFSPLKLPAADGTANKPITTDGSGQLQFSPNTLPATIGTAGQVMKVNAGATALEYGSVSVPLFKKTIDFKTNPAQSTVVTWASIDPSIAFSNIAAVRLTIMELSASADTYLLLYGLSSSGSRITTGYWGATYRGTSGSTTQNNNGYMKFPAYGAAVQSTNYAYGSGMTGEIVFNPWREGSGNELTTGGQASHYLSWQYNTEAHPYVEHGGWSHYNDHSSTMPPWEGGIDLYSNSNNFDHGRVVVEVILEG